MHANRQRLNRASIVIGPPSITFDPAKHFILIAMMGQMKANTHFKKPEQDTALAENTRRPLVRAEVIAKHFDVHKRTVALWADRGDIPCVRVGGALRFNMEAVLGATR